MTSPKSVSTVSVSPSEVSAPTVDAQDVSSSPVMSAARVSRVWRAGVKFMGLSTKD
ncbi:hypothetical protein [Salana multivorans]